MTEKIVNAFLSGVCHPKVDTFLKRVAEDEAQIQLVEGYQYDAIYVYIIMQHYLLNIF